MACDKEVLEIAIKEIARRANTLELLYFYNDIVWIEDSNFTFIILKNYFEPNDIEASRNALELYHIAPKAFKNPSSCADIMLRAVLERGYNKSEIIPYLHAVIRVVMRCAELFAIISNNNEVMFGDDADTDIFQQYLKAVSDNYLVEEEK